MSWRNTSVLIPDLGFCDGLRWRPGELWFSDFLRRRVYCYHLRRQHLTEMAYVAGQPSGLGFLPDGSILIVSMHDRLLLRLGNDGRLAVYADLAHVATGPLNDLVVDSAGRAYVGSYGYQAAYEPPEQIKPASLHRIDPDGSIRTVADGLMFPNGMAIDGPTLVVAETFANRLSAYPIANDGSLGDREILANLADRGPDGICADAGGALWVACPFAQEVVRISPGGGVSGVLRLPDRWAVDVAMDLDTSRLFVSTAKTTLEAFHRGVATGAIEIFDCSEIEAREV